MNRYFILLASVYLILTVSSCKEEDDDNDAARRYAKISSSEISTEYSGGEISSTREDVEAFTRIPLYRGIDVRTSSSETEKDASGDTTSSQIRTYSYDSDGYMITRTEKEDDNGDGTLERDNIQTYYWSDDHMTQTAIGSDYSTPGIWIEETVYSVFNTSANYETASISIGYSDAGKTIANSKRVQSETGFVVSGERASLTWQEDEYLDPTSATKSSSEKETNTYLNNNPEFPLTQKKEVDADGDGTFECTKRDEAWTYDASNIMVTQTQESDKNCDGVLDEAGTMTVTSHTLDSAGYPATFEGTYEDSVTNSSFTFNMTATNDAAGNQLTSIFTFTDPSTGQLIHKSERTTAYVVVGTTTETTPF